jgi:2-amino-4-hydroxy-6-hydroxymethyldihydropteridine diphosphokinase
VVSASPVYETVPWGGVDQSPFLNAVVIADDPAVDCRGWLRRGQQLEAAAERVRGQRWGPRTLDVDLVSCVADGTEVVVREPDLTLPHPLAHLRAFVLVPWLAVDPQAQLTVADVATPVARLLEDIEPIDKAGVMPTDLTLRSTE